MSRGSSGARYMARPRSVAEMQPPMPASDDSMTDDPDQDDYGRRDYPRSSPGDRAAGASVGGFSRGGSARSNNYNPGGGYNGYPEGGYVPAGGSFRGSAYSQSASRQVAAVPLAATAQVQPQSGPRRRGAWGKFVSCMLCFWKVMRCLCSHITLVTIVVAYCLLGAAMFENLEAENEQKVKEGIVHLRINVTDHLWAHTSGSAVLHQENWTILATEHLRDFEKAILKAMRKDGWDGIEDTNQLQWTFAGALFYSIIVITTIGYGHIAPKTQMGKVATILYAIAGIPLMLLCLSNIGDVMAHSFRFLYWRVCCFVCTRDPQPARRSRSRSASTRTARSQLPAHQALQAPPSRWGSGAGGGVTGGSMRSRSRATSATPGGRRFPSTRSGDSAIQIDISRSSHSDTECRFDNRRHIYDDDELQYPTVPRQNDPNKFSKMYQSAGAVGGPVLSNKYALDREESFKIRRQQLRAQSVGREPRRPVYYKPGGSLPRHYRLREQLQVHPNTMAQPPPTYDTMRSRYSYNSGYSGSRRCEPASLRTPSPRIMSPMGFRINRQYYTSQEYDSTWDMETDGGSSHPSRTRPVPIWLCIFLVVSYIIGGAYLFSHWEKWGYLDSAYFCFITLTTIGFGDFVPAQAEKRMPKESIALCSLYLLFGIALLAMSFNLVQEEVLSSVRSVARRLGIIKADDDEY